MHSILERIEAEEEECDNNFQEEEEGGAHSLKDVCDIRRPEPSPFSSRRVMFENEEVLQFCFIAAFLLIVDKIHVVSLADPSSYF